MSEHRWYVIRTNPQCEDRAKASLEAAGFIVYLPKLKRERRHHRTKQWQTLEYPLFTRYLFVGMEPDKEHWGHVRKCDGVECALGVQGKPLQVPANDVHSFIESQARGDFDDMRRSSVKRPHAAGDIIEVTEGPFAGFSGNVQSVRGKKTVEVMLKIFGRLTPVNINERHVRAA